MVSFRCRLIWVLGLGLLHPVLAQSSVQLRDKVVSGRAQTYADLLRVLEGRRLRNLESVGEGAAVPSAASVQGASCFWLPDGNRKLLVLLAEGGGFGVLALYRFDGRFALMDAVDVTRGPHTSLSARPLLTIQRDHPAFRLSHWHDNSSESYDQTTVVGVVGGRLRALLQLPTAYGFAETFLPEVCKTAASYDLAVAPAGRHGYRDLTVRYQQKTVAHANSPDFDWNTGILDRRTLEQTATWNPRLQVYQRPVGQVRHASGVVESVSEGRSELRLGGLRLAYPVGFKFAPRPPRPGEVWRFDYTRGWSGDELLEAHFQGRSEACVQAAVEVVRRYSRALHKGDYSAAYASFSHARRQRRSLDEFVRLSSDVDFAALDEWKHGFKVLFYSRGAVRLLALTGDARDGEEGCLCFTVVRQGSVWVLDRVEALPLGAWIRS